MNQEIEAITADAATPDVAGHTSLTTTLRYMHAVDGATDDAIDALERFDAHESGHFPRAPIRIRHPNPSQPSIE